MSLHLLRAMPVRSIALAAYANTVPSLLTPAQVCERLSIGDATLRRYAQNNPTFFAKGETSAAPRCIRCHRHRKSTSKR